MMTTKPKTRKAPAKAASPRDVPKEMELDADAAKSLPCNGGSLLYQVYFPTRKLCYGKTPYIAGPDLGRTDQGWRGPPYRYRFWALKVPHG